MESDSYIRELSESVLKRPEDHTLRLRLGMALFDRRRYKEALANFQKARQDENIREQAMDMIRMTMKELKLI